MNTSKGAAVVTGAANGIGHAYARRLAADGFDIAVADVVDARATRALVEAEPSDLAGVVSFLCSPDSGFVTGQTIAADGGQVRN